MTVNKGYRNDVTFLGVVVKHPGASAGIVQEIIITDLIRYDTPVLHVECHDYADPCIRAIVFDYLYRININPLHRIPPADIVFKDSGAHVGFVTCGQVVVPKVLVVPFSPHSCEIPARKFGRILNTGYGDLRHQRRGFCGLVREALSSYGRRLGNCCLGWQGSCGGCY